MAQAIWQGNLVQRSRTVSGIFLLIYAFFHFLNIAAGLVSPDFMIQVQHARALATGHLPGQILLFGALFLHGGLALWQVASRRTLRMTVAQAVQLFFGLAIPLQLIQHVVFTNYADRVFEVEDHMSSVILLLWNSPEIWQQYLLLLLVWVHGCIGMHMWLRITWWWRSIAPYLIGVAVLVPTLALAGLITEGRRMWSIYIVPGNAEAIREDFNWPDLTEFAHLTRVAEVSLWVFFALLATAISAFYIRRFARKRQSVRIHYENGPDITVERGLTLLEISQLNGVPHTSLCGGKGRCTTCRVAVIKGGDSLPAASPAEARSLLAVKAPPDVRLACQIYPTAALTVKRVYRPKGRRRVHSAQGEEKTIAVLFLDIRGFTARSADLLPYDVVFLLNRFFDAVVPEITRAGGTVDKYMGDGLLALFEMDSAAASSKAAIDAVSDIGVALARFNRLLASEGDEPVRIGMGLHTGTVVLGEIGTTSHAPRTLIGATVNTASRLEAKTKDLGVELLISEQVVQIAGLWAAKAKFQTFELRGVEQPLNALPVPRASTLVMLLSAPPEPEDTVTILSEPV
ncbi:MAG: 2Fe-2S iron-sulfur cluster binding domain-containing protein [Rhodobacteraceae bacterium]|nr:2Fe-2S iron-sulfur cluster binding domain-containing protein [Paracoccaceae bacterium]